MRTSCTRVVAERFGTLGVKSLVAMLLLVAGVWGSASGALAQTDTVATKDKTLETAAVLSFRMEGMPETAGQALANIVRREVLENGRLVLIDRDRTEAVLSEKGLMMAGGCYDVSCMVEAGRVLGAQQVITGSVNSLGSTYIIELRSASVASGRIEALETKEYRGEVDGLTEPVREMARRLIASLVNKPGWIDVSTSPNSSSVEVDDVPIGFSPIVVERPSGIQYKVNAVRPGYESEPQRVLLGEGDTVHVAIDMDRVKRTRRRPYDPTVRIFVSGGFPMQQASSTLDSRLSWGSGQSYGASLQFGTVWRLGIGGYVYSSVLENVPDSLWSAYGAVKSPRSDAFVSYASLNLMLGGHSFSPFIGGGVAAMERTVRLQLEDNQEEGKTTSFEVGWMLNLGVEIGITRFLAARVELTHARSLASEQTWNRDSTDAPEVWVRSFDDFTSFTVLRLGVGLKL